MKHLKIETYYYDRKEVVKTEQPAYISNERLYVGNKKIEYEISNINYEIREVNGMATLILVNPMFRTIALEDFEKYLFSKTELYKQLQELKKLAE